MLHAFPTPKENMSTEMSLRDYMATAIFCSVIQHKYFDPRHYEQDAKSAYDFADALLRARQHNRR